MSDQKTPDERNRSVSKPLTNKKGWDGKLRQPSKDGPESDSEPDSEGEEQSEPESKVTDGRRAALTNTNPMTDPYFQDSEAPSPPLLAADEDLLDDEPTDTTDIDLVHCRISRIASLNLFRFTDVERLCLRQNAIGEIDFPPEFGRHILELDLYDNLIKHVAGLSQFAQTLQTLDLSFNKVQRIEGVDQLSQLTHLYFVHNRIHRIEGLRGLSSLKMLELAANRIREIDSLEDLTLLEELWLAKNKITEIKNLDHLVQLKLLSIQSNRLTSISGLSNLTNLEELHISHNGITAITGLENNIQLRVLDISQNPISHLQNLSHLTHLEELWASNCRIGDFAEVERELGGKQDLTTVYFEGNPLQLNGPAVYRNKVRLALPQVKQIDATFVKVP